MSLIKIEDYIVDTDKIKLQETISKKDIESWHKDFQAFTKNIRRINSLSDLEKVKKAARIWSSNFSDFIYSNFLGQKGYSTEFSQQAFNDAITSSWYKEARDKVWSLVVSLENAFELSRGSYDPYLTWEKNRDSTYQKIARLGREAFESLYSFFDTQELYQDLLVTDIINVLDYKVTVIYAESDFYRIKDEIKKLEQALNNIERAVKKKGFKEVLDNLRITYDLQGSSSSYLHGAASAFYQEGNGRNNDFVSIAFVGEHEIIHELGHRWYAIELSKEQRNQWKDFYKEGVIYVPYNEAYQFAEYMLNRLDFSKYRKMLEEDESNNYNSEFRKEVNEYIYKIARDYDGSDTINYFIENFILYYSKSKYWSSSWNPLFKNNDGKDTVKSYLDWIASSAVNEVNRTGCYNVNMSSRFVSDYGQTNEKEYYAETFLHYILDDYYNNDIPEIVLEQFLIISKKI